jgi:hypothetical protein
VPTAGADVGEAGAKGRAGAAAELHQGEDRLQRGHGDEQIDEYAQRAFTQADRDQEYRQRRQQRQPGCFGRLRQQRQRAHAGFAGNAERGQRLGIDLPSRQRLPHREGNRQQLQQRQDKQQAEAKQHAAREAAHKKRAHQRIGQQQHGSQLEGQQRKGTIAALDQGGEQQNCGEKEEGAGFESVPCAYGTAFRLHASCGVRMG